MLPAFLHEILHHGPEGLGVLRAAPALGSVCVGLWLARRPLQRNAGRVLLFAVAGFGLCVIGFGLSSNFWLSAAILLFYGAFDGVSVVVRSTILQLATPEEMRGRVSSINGIFISSSNELGVLCGHDGEAVGAGPGGGAGRLCGVERGRDHGLEESDAAAVESARSALRIRPKKTRPKPGFS